jgi:hypothetical protein
MEETILPVSKQSLLAWESMSYFENIVIWAWHCIFIYCLFEDCWFKNNCFILAMVVRKTCLMTKLSLFCTIWPNGTRPASFHLCSSSIQYPARWDEWLQISSDPGSFVFLQIIMKYFKYKSWKKGLNTCETTF